MARSNGHNGQAAPPVRPQEAAPTWQHPSDPGHAAPQQHAYVPPPFPAGFPPSPDLPPFGQSPHDPYAGQGHPPSNYMPYPAAASPHHAAAYQAPAHQSPPPQPHQWGAQQHSDPQGYDLGQFGHGQPAPLTHDPYARTAPPTAQPQQWSQQPFHDPQLSAQHAFAEPVPSQRGPMPFVQAPPAFAGAAGALRAEHPAAPMRHPQQQQQLEPEFDDEDYEEELDEEPKRGRKLMVVGALVGAICVGGGLAYAYKTFSGGKTPLLNAQKQQPKATPAQAPKVAAKLPDAVPTQAVAAASATDDGVRRVQSIVIAPPGGAAVAAPQPTPPPSAAPMPGMVLDNMPRVPAPAIAPPPAATAPLRPSTAPAQVAVPPAPAVKAPPLPKVAMVNPAAAPEAAPPPARKAVAVPKKTPDAFNPNVAVAAVAPAPATAKSALGAGGANGYVATVLSTQRGRPEAMKAFADLQQKFPDVLGGKPAEVQEKDLGAEKGVWYRAVVGPPGSRDAATSVCVQLKASGYGQCFVTAY